jgi:amino acid transporter
MNDEKELENNNPEPPESDTSLKSGGKRQSFKVASLKKTEPTRSPDTQDGNETVSAGHEINSTPSITRISSFNAGLPTSEPDDSTLLEHSPKRGKRPGDRYIRMTKANLDESVWKQSNLRYQAEDSVPRSALGRLWKNTKRVIVGRPLPTSLAHHQRLSKIQALAVLSSDALSSTAYATEEILLVLILTGSASLVWGLPVAIAIALLLVVVALSYRQTIAAYPKGGGSYIVAKDNLGVTPGLIAAASLLIDYILTVAVSISAGVAAITSAIPALTDFKVEICLGFIAFITLANLRGVRESGMIFTLPTYLFIASMIVMLLMGFLKILFGIEYGSPVSPPEIIHNTHEELTLFLILRAFSSGCTALTGVEAISDGVPAFREPEAKNARTTLTWMVAILGVLFVSITYMAIHFKVEPIEPNADHYQTVVSLIARNILGDNPFYFVVQVSTMMILVLAANTAFSDFPRLSWFLARDRFLPNLFKHQGDRLAYSTGIIALGLLAGFLVLVFGGNTNSLIPLYAVGVFASFTLSQAGMVVRWWRLRTPGWIKSIVMNGMGCLATFVVLIIIGATKFLLGAWMVIALIPVLYLMFLSIHKHYTRFSDEIQLTSGKPSSHEVEALNMEHHTVVVPVSDLNQVTLRTLSYARALSDQVTALYASDNSENIENLRERWDDAGIDIPLVGVETPFRNIIGALLTYLDDLHRREPDETITVVVPEFVTAKWWQRLLHNQTALRLKTALFTRPGIVIISVPYHLEK